MNQQKQLNSHAPALRERFELKWVEVLTNHFKRQERAITSRVNPALESGKGDIGGGVWWDSERWNEELYQDLIKLNLATASEWAFRLFEEIDSFPRDLESFQDRMIPYIVEHSKIQAFKINQLTEDLITEALIEQDPLKAVRNVFVNAIVRAIQESKTAVTSMSSFGSSEAAQSRGLARKTWHVNSQNPRESHAALDGVTVGIRDVFPNQMRWPGDPAGGADEIAGCQCSVEFSK